MDYKIGVGVTTTSNRKEHYELVKSQILLHTDNIEICHTLDTKTISEGKNYCLKHLSDCDYIFLFDDDCCPIDYGWAEYFINAHKKTGNHHFMYLNHTHIIKERHLTAEKFEGTGFNSKGNTILVNSYKSCGGCMMFLTKEVVEKVGYYYNGYGQYGYEHAGYSNRIHQAGLTPYGMYLCPNDAHKYIHSMDLDAPLFDIKHKPSLPISTCMKSVEENKAHYLEDIKQVYRGL